MYDLQWIVWDHMDQWYPRHLRLLIQWIVFHYRRQPYLSLDGTGTMELRYLCDALIFVVNSQQND